MNAVMSFQCEVKDMGVGFFRITPIVDQTVDLDAIRKQFEEYGRSLSRTISTVPPLPQEPGRDDADTSHIVGGK